MSANLVATSQERIARLEIKIEGLEQALSLTQQERDELKFEKRQLNSQLEVLQRPNPPSDPARDPDYLRDLLNEWRAAYDKLGVQNDKAKVENDKLKVENETLREQMHRLLSRTTDSWTGRPSERGALFEDYDGEEPNPYSDTKRQLLPGPPQAPLERTRYEGRDSTLEPSYKEQSGPWLPRRLRSAPRERESPVALHTGTKDGSQPKSSRRERFSPPYQEDIEADTQPAPAKPEGVRKASDTKPAVLRQSLPEQVRTAHLPASQFTMANIASQGIPPQNTNNSKSV